VVLRALGLGKTFQGPDGGPVPVLRGVDLEVKTGEFVAVTGPSGCGKSTLLNLVGLLEPPDTGEVWLDDECVSRLSRRAQCRVRGRAIGYVFQ
jgi:putative ABC transport system ATP-binding protein